jgi:signal transduction histidine kinase
VLATTIYRIIQESLTNIGKHAKAANVDVLIARRRRPIKVTVSDDGVGFAPDAARKPQSYGLLGIRERAYLLKGEAEHPERPGQGHDGQRRAAGRRRPAARG